MEFNFSDLDFYYINLDSDLEKSKKLEIKLDLLDVDPKKIHRVKAYENQESYIGILYSQIEAIELGLKSGNPFVVLEDDVDVNNYVEKINVPDESKCTYLGLSSWGFDSNFESLARNNSIESFEVEGFPDLKRIKNMFSAHSILYYDKKFTEELLMNLKLVREGKKFIIDGKEHDFRYYGKSIIPCDIVMALMQNYHLVTALKIPFFYQTGEHEYCTRISLN
jgi:hypothetical protein